MKITAPNTRRRITILLSSSTSSSILRDNNIPKFMYRSQYIAGDSTQKCSARRPIQSCMDWQILWCYQSIIYIVSASDDAKVVKESGSEKIVVVDARDSSNVCFVSGVVWVCGIDHIVISSICFVHCCF